MVSSGSSLAIVDFRPAPIDIRLLDNFIRSIIVDVISEVETIFGAAGVVDGALFGEDLVSVALDFALSSTASKALERTLGEALDLEGVLPRAEVEALRGVVLLLVDSDALGVVDSGSSIADAAARREGV